VSAQVRKHLGDRHPGFLARGDRTQLDIGMARQQTQQLNPGVSRSAHYADFNHVCSYSKVCQVYRVIAHKKAASRRPFCIA
jgi:hypothetical protein